jgi:hypothetical protein
MSKQLGHDAQLSATEIVRRAERGIGVAIRRGQDGGTIRGNGRPETFHQGESSLPSPTDFASKGELYGGGNGGKAGIYAVTDGVSDSEPVSRLREIMRLLPAAPRDLAAAAPGASFSGLPAASDLAKTADGRTWSLSSPSHALAVRTWCGRRGSWRCTRG